MANLTPTNKKVTELPVATTIAPTDVLLVVQGGVTKQVSQDTVAAAVAGSTQLTATSVTLWKASTAYKAGQAVLNPSGAVVTALADFTSGSTYDPTKWSTPPGSGFALVDNGDGTATLNATGTATITDNGDGTASIAA